MSEPPAFLEDYANALGHVVISYNAMEQAVADLAALLWRDQPDNDVTRLLGRRSLDERLGLLAAKLNDPTTRHAHDADWINQLDRLLASCRPLAADRHDAVHRAVMGIEPDGSTSWAQDLDDWSIVDDLIALSDAIDQQSAALVQAVQSGAEQRLGNAS